MIKSESFSLTFVILNLNQNINFYQYITVMGFQQFNDFFPFKKLLKLLLAMAIGIQIIVITYNHLSGFYLLENPSHFIYRLMRGTILSLIAGFMIAIPDLYLIRFLNRSFHWINKAFRRIVLQLSFTLILALVISTLITLFANLVNTYSEDLTTVLIYNGLIYCVVNIILMMIFEAWLFSMESSKARMKAEALEKEISQIRFDVLKNQINPHFMFNSLNVLSGLIDKDVAKAQLFIDEFSQIYRYVLETIEKPVVSLSDELSFVRSYFFLQQIRYGEALTLTVDIPADLIHLLLPPLSLQMVLENAIKHNIVNQSKPLEINIYNDNHWLIVRNNLQPKISSNFSTGLGQKNLAKRYALIGEDKPRFMISSNHYIVQLPLIQPDYDESTDN